MFPLLKVSICPFSFGEIIADDFLVAWGAEWTGTYVTPSTTIGFIVLF